MKARRRLGQLARGRALRGKAELAHGSNPLAALRQGIKLRRRGTAKPQHKTLLAVDELI